MDMLGKNLVGIVKMPNPSNDELLKIGKELFYLNFYDFNDFNEKIAFLKHCV